MHSIGALATQHIFLIACVYITTCYPAHESHNIKSALLIILCALHQLLVESIGLGLGLMPCLSVLWIAMVCVILVSDVCHQMAGQTHGLEI